MKMILSGAIEEFGGAQVQREVDLVDVPGIGSVIKGDWGSITVSSVTYEDGGGISLRTTSLVRSLSYRNFPIGMIENEMKQFNKEKGERIDRLMKLGWTLVE